MRSVVIRPGQVWEDRDRRRPGRRIRVSSVDVSNGRAWGFLEAVVVEHPMKPHAVGRTTTIAVGCLPDYYDRVAGPCDSCGADDGDHWSGCPWGQEPPRA